MAVFVHNNYRNVDEVFDQTNFVEVVKKQKHNIVKAGGRMHYRTTGYCCGYGTRASYNIDDGISVGSYTMENDTKTDGDLDICLNFLRHQLCEGCNDIHCVIPHLVQWATLMSKALKEVLGDLIKTSNSSLIPTGSIIY